MKNSLINWSLYALGVYCIAVGNPQEFWPALGTGLITAAGIRLFIGSVNS